MRLFNSSMILQNHRKRIIQPLLSREFALSAFMKSLFSTHASRSSDQHVSTRCDVNFDLFEKKRQRFVVWFALESVVIDPVWPIIGQMHALLFARAIRNSFRLGGKVTRGDEKIICIFLRGATTNWIDEFLMSPQWELENNKPRKSCLGAYRLSIVMSIILF